jgi:hypothetical protein
MYLYVIMLKHFETDAVTGGQWTGRRVWGNVAVIELHAYKGTVNTFFIS